MTAMPSRFPTPNLLKVLHKLAYAFPGLQEVAALAPE